MTTGRISYALALATVIGVAGYVVISHDKSRADMTIDEKTRQIAQREIEADPGRFSDEAKRNILMQKITVGMTPHEARLAGGSFFYQVEADPKRWPRGSNPLIVIASQTDQPDDSKITLTFQNRTQFQTQEPTTFRVEIRRGKVTEIVRMDK
jgi:hypothetical protein